MLGVFVLGVEVVEFCEFSFEFTAEFSSFEAEFKRKKAILKPPHIA